MNQLSFLELKQVASLKNNPGYLILMDALLAELDSLTDQLRLSNPGDTPQILAKWRVYTEIYQKLLTIPEEFVLEVANFEQDEIRQREMPQRVIDPVQKVEFTQEALDKLQALYNAKKEKLK